MTGARNRNRSSLSSGFHTAKFSADYKARGLLDLRPNRFSRFFATFRGTWAHYTCYNIIVCTSTLTDIQCRHFIPALNLRTARVYYTTACPITTQFPGRGCDQRSLTSQLNVTLIRKPRWSLICFGLLFDISYPWVFVQPGTGKHLAGRLVQESNVCTVTQQSII